MYKSIALNASYNLGFEIKMIGWNAGPQNHEEEVRSVWLGPLIGLKLELNHLKTKFETRAH